jgi:Domain of unknown function (DUF4129)
MPGIDKPTTRVVALIVLLIVVAAALRGYLPARDRVTHVEQGGGRAAMLFVIAALTGTIALLAIAIIARLRDPRAAAPYNRDLSEMLGTGRGRPSWRVLLIALGVIIAWVLIVLLVNGFLGPHGVAPSAPPPNTSAPPPPQANPSPPRQSPPQNDGGDMLRTLLAATIPIVLMIIAGSVIMSRRRWRAAMPATIVDDGVEAPVSARRSESLARAAEVGLAEMADLSREPRAAIIACYAAMEHQLANVPGAVPQEFDTPTEVLARAVDHHALHADNAVQLVNLFEEARFSPHVMTEEHREVAVHVLRLVLAELRSPV